MRNPAACGSTLRGCPRQTGMRQRQMHREARPVVGRKRGWKRVDGRGKLEVSENKKNQTIAKKKKKKKRDSVKVSWFRGVGGGRKNVWRWWKVDGKVIGRKKGKERGERGERWREWGPFRGHNSQNIKQPKTAWFTTTRTQTGTTKKNTSSHRKVDDKEKEEEIVWEEKRRERERERERERARCQNRKEPPTEKTIRKNTKIQKKMYKPASPEEQCAKRHQAARPGRRRACGTSMCSAWYHAAVAVAVAVVADAVPSLVTFATTA